jgi:ubiquinone/menaquinone biosynthesis C-methylase UbiE/purine-nucleoside phosphorylase
LLKELTKADWLNILNLPESRIPNVLIVRGTRNFRSKYGAMLPYFDNVLEVGTPNGIIEDVLIGDVGGLPVGFACVYGSSMASEIVHIFGVLGTRTVIQIGNCGALADDFAAGDLFVAERAYCGEGAAQYYKPAGKWVMASSELLQSRTLSALRPEEYRTGAIYTTGALFAEGMDDVERWFKEGFGAVDMETAATFAVADSFGMKRISILYAFDNPRQKEHLLLSDKDKDVRRASANDRMQHLALDLAVEISANASAGEMVTTPATKTNEPANKEEVYSVGYEAATAAFIRARRAATHAAFFLPHLRTGMRLLDAGCGPGTITIDFAAVVAPAEVVGVDVEQSQIDLARKQAAERGISNARFEVANLYALPFSPESFDAVFLHGVLEHVQDPVSALHEVRRVLKRGGVVGARHADFGGFIIEPAPVPLDQFAILFERLMLRNSTYPRAGRHQIRWLRESGFSRIEASASYDCWTKTPEETGQNAAFLASLVRNSPFSAQLLEASLADRATLELLSEQFNAWGRNPDAFAAEAWGEAVAWQT